MAFAWLVTWTWQAVALNGRLDGGNSSRSRNKRVVALSRLVAHAGRRRRARRGGHGGNDPDDASRDPLELAAPC